MTKHTLLAAAVLSTFALTASAENLELSADLVVIGGGAAGMPAAVQAAEKGRTVIVLEKNGFVGGGANAAEGLFAVESSWQRGKSIGITREEAFQYLMNYSHFKADPELTRRYVWGSAGNLEWLHQFGMDFDPIQMTPHDAPTWHVVQKYKNSEHGAAYIQCLRDAALERGVRIMTNTPVTELIKEDGRVVGVKATKKNGDTVTVKSKATIIATGGFGNSKEKVRDWLGLDPEVFKASVPLNKTGDGIEMAWKAGADKTPMLLMLHAGIEGKGIEFPGALYCMAWQPFNMWVNAEGSRFVDETQAFSFPNGGNAIGAQRGSTAWAIWDNNSIEYVQRAGIDNGIGVIVPVLDKLPKLKDEIKAALDAGNSTFVSAESLDALAAKIGVPAESLRATVAEYNGFAKDGHDLDFGKSRKYLRTLEGSTFYAVKLFPFHYTSLGGIRIDPDFHVVTPDRKPIPGLYAAGVDVGPLYGDTYAVWTSGHSFGWSSWSGRHAALSAVADMAK
ncbi:FAD-dependent oxidoreductase [Sutterella sp.]|uniref:FAD-dependent oxidoreductase n=1 Tax=Sutterella sp. TaxID=1981025 RepID=UPI0026DEF297|nr:FAD-dependent oxidoreductase [Sutterella sp.]MDO5530776.1 FAD-dependent oxidoreductase [Sutterella sp.]